MRFWGVLVVLFCGMLVYAQEKEEDKKKVEEEKFRLPKVTVTAPAAAPKELLDAPYSVSKTDADEFSQQPRSNFPDMVSQMVGVMGQKTCWGYTSPFIRGFTGYRTLLIIDGVRFNNSVIRSGPNEYWGTVDMFSVSGVELLRGPASLLYGSDALGGVVSATTYDPFDEKVQRLIGRGRLTYRFASAEQANTANLRVMKSSERCGITIGATTERGGDLICGKHIGLQPYSGYSRDFADFRLDYLLSERWRLTFATHYGEATDIERTHKTIYAKSWYRTKVGSSSIYEYNNYRTLSYLQLRAKRLDGVIDGLHMSLSYQLLHKWKVTQKDGSTVRKYTGFDVGTTGFFVNATTKKTPEGRFTFGLDFYTDTIDSYYYEKDFATGTRTTEARGGIADDSTYDLAGLFVEDELVLSPKLTLFVGLRYSYARIDAGVVDPDPTDAFPYEPFENSYDALVGSVRLIGKLRETKTVSKRLIFGVSQGFRAPNMDDTTTFKDVATDSYDVPAPDVEPEYCTNYEVGYRSFFAKREDRYGLLELFYFYNRLQDFIERVPTTYAGSPTDPDGRRYYAKENFASGYIHGVELSVEGAKKLEEWGISEGYLKFGASWLEGYGDALLDKDGDGVPETKTVRPLRRTPPPTARLRCGIRTKLGKWKSNWFVEYIHTLKQDKLSPGDEKDTSRIPPGGTPGYYLINFGFEVYTHKNTKITLFIENLTNRDWRIHGSGTNGPGTNIVLTHEWRF